MLCGTFAYHPPPPRLQFIWLSWQVAVAVVTLAAAVAVFMAGSMTIAGGGFGVAIAVAVLMAIAVASSIAVFVTTKSRDSANDAVACYSCFPRPCGMIFQPKPVVTLEFL